MQNYVFALRASLMEMEEDGSDQYASLEKLDYLTRDLVSALRSTCRQNSDELHCAYSGVSASDDEAPSIIC